MILPFRPRTWSVTLTARMKLQDDVRGKTNEGSSEDHGFRVLRCQSIDGSDWVQVVAVDVQGTTNSDRKPAKHNCLKVPLVSCPLSCVAFDVHVN